MVIMEPPQCSIHLGLKQVFYCMECEELLCRRCMMDNHRLHNYDETEVVVNMRSAAIRDLIEPVERALKSNEESFDVSEMKEKLAAHHKELKISLKHQFERIHEHVSDREIYLLACLQSFIEKECLKIEDASQDFQQLLSEYQITITNALRVVEEPKGISLLTEGKQILRDLEKSIETLQGTCQHVHLKDRLVFEADTLTLKNSIAKFGALVDANNETVRHSVKPRSLSRNISLPIISKLTDQPKSDLSISVLQPAAVISCTEKGKKFYPCGIAVGSNNLITVSDLHNNFVKVLTGTGKVIDTIENNKGSHSIIGPCALHVDQGNDIYVLERDSKSIRKYTNGSLLDLGKFNKQIDDPRGILVLKERVYITDWKKNCIHILTLSCNKLSYLSTAGEGFLKQPAGIASDITNDKIVVCDQENHCVWVLTLDGDVENIIGGERGNQLGMLNVPYGVAVTGDGKVVISEKGNCRISVFSLQGLHLFSFGCKGSDPGQFNQLRHVCTNFNKQVLVADEMNQRVQIFDLY